MKNIVIAAGYATRLGELTANYPKPLLKFDIGSLDTYKEACELYGKQSLVKDFSKDVSQDFEPQAIHN